MSIDEEHVALPTLYGAPAYARPATVALAAPRPFDPDDLPIDAFQSDEDRQFAADLPARAWAPGGTILEGASGAGRPPRRQDRKDHRLRGRPFSVRTIAGRLLGGP